MNKDSNIPIGIGKLYEVQYFNLAQICNSVIDNIRMGQYPMQRKLKLINYTKGMNLWVFIDEQGALTILSHSQIACITPVEEEEDYNDLERILS